MRLLLMFVWLCSLCPSLLCAEPIPDGLRGRLRLDPFYQKYADADGLPVIGSAHVQQAALNECAWIVRKMLSQRPDILQALVDANVRFVIMAHHEYTTDVPEHSRLQPKVYWDRRARGLGATPETPVVSGGEENLLAFPGDPYPTEIIPLHEFAHAIHLVAMRKVDPTFQTRLNAAFERARAKGLWQNTYAAVNVEEYWAESVQAWFDNNAENNSLHNEVNTRAELIAYDPMIADLCRDVFGENAWRYLPPTQRAPEDRQHLEGWDATQAPTFQWREVPVPANPKISVETPLGIYEVQLQNPVDNQTLPVQKIENFLEQVHSGWFSNATLTKEKESWRLTAGPKGQGEIPIPEGTAWFLVPKSLPVTDRSEVNRISVEWDQEAKLIEKMGKIDQVSVQRIVRRN